MSSDENDWLLILQSALSSEDEKLLGDLFENCSFDKVAEWLCGDPTLFVQVCARGFTSNVYFLLENCKHVIDLFAELDGRTALQWACFKGHTDIVERLLAVYQQKNLPLQKEAWQEQSEFYSACRGGHMKIVELLMNVFPEKLRDMDILQVLLYAACVGGYLPLVRQRLVPSIDINQPLRLVDSLHDCEHRTPLQAAFEGSHTEVSALLMEHFKAEVTEYLANRFPDFTQKLVDRVYCPLRVFDDDEVKYNLSQVNSHVVQAAWFESYLNVITHMDLSKNKLKHLPVCVPWAMANLVHLDVSHNRLLKLLPPESKDDIVCDKLETVNASHNNIVEVCTDLFQRPSLFHLDLSHNALQKLSKLQLSANSPDFRRNMWMCESLTTLNLSHNRLELLPADNFKNCTAMVRLDLSHNRLCSLPSPWECKLEHLNVSHNQLTRFPPSTEQFWSGSLTHLIINNNSLDQLEESILKLGMIQKLNASNNNIQYLAPAHLWDCPSLEVLNLSHNSLGKTQQANKKNAARAIEFPSELMSEELRSLNLSGNQLTHLPLSVCYIKNLAFLDISHNSIKELPPEMGNLQSCWDLRLEGLSLTRADQLDFVKNGKPLDLIEHLRKQLRKVQPSYILKVVVIGPQNKGKSTVIESLVRANANEVKLSNQPVTVTSASLKSPCRMKMKERSDSERPEIALRIWELAGNPELAALHPILWSENCLFLLVWDMTEGVSGLGHWLSNIRSRLERVKVVLVATFKDRIPTAEVDSRVHQFHRDINNLYGDREEDVGTYPKEDNQKIFPHLSSVVFLTNRLAKHEILELRSAVYFSGLRLIKAVRPPEFIVGQLLPNSYLVIEKKLNKMAQQFKESGHPPYLTQQEFDELLRSDPAADFHIFDDQLEALEIWRQLGSVLHYDVWADGLGQLYFLDPVWLASMIASVLMPEGVSVAYRQSMTDVYQRLIMAGYPSNIFKPFLQLLKHFDIGTLLVDQDCLLLPCLLPKSAPGLQLSHGADGCRLLRFYAMPHVPGRLWSRLILGILMSMDRFSQTYWQGVDAKKAQIMYWQEGLTIKYAGGSIVIESSVFVATEESTRYPGILISFQTDSSTLGDLAVVGFVTDEIDSALQNIFPHYNENNGLFGIYALCPVCYHDVQPCAGVIRGSKLHFALSDCAGDLLHSYFAQCYCGSKVALEDLIPEFLMGELPERFHLHSEEVHLGNKLGGGAAGTVYQGVLFGDPVAIKVFYWNVFAPPTPIEDPVTTDSGTSTMSSTTSQLSIAECGSPPGTMLPEYGNFRDVADEAQQRQRDKMDGRNLKVCRAFSELRQEIVILSQLRHPCLVSLLGVSIRPSLLVVLELAPFGSLRSVLNDYMKDRPFNKYRDKEQTFSSVLDKDITFKIVYQVGLGLEYLHNHRILYRDLKSDNILVCSMAVTDRVNVKISDYGISKFTTSQGLMGMVGTPGYMAPEIMDGQAYNEKVDIFSFSMVIYELLTGHPPFEKYGRLHQIHQLINWERCRPSLVEYNVVSNFPYLEDMMEKMWAHDPRDRPSATDVVRQMEDVGFVLQHAHLAKSSDLQDHGRPAGPSSTGSSVEGGLFCGVTCVWAMNYASRTTSITGRNNCWVWESPSTITVDRRYCITNLASGKLQTPSCKESHGCPVTCMAQIGQHKWIGSMGNSQNKSQSPKVDSFSTACGDLARGKRALFNLVSDPVAIIQDKDNPNIEKQNIGSQGFVYIALTDGTVKIYRHQARSSAMFHKTRCTSSEWQHYKDVTVTTTSTIQAMCLVPSQKELLVGCGHSIVIISTESHLVEGRICLQKDLPPSVKDKVSSIQIMVRNEHTLWCSFKNSPLIVEFEMHPWRLSRAYCIEADLEVYITEVMLGTGLLDNGVCESCNGMSSLVSGHRPGQANSKSKENQDESKEDNALSSPPPRPPKSTKPGFSVTQAASPVIYEENSGTEDVPVEIEEVQLRPKLELPAPDESDRKEIPSGVHDSISEIITPDEMGLRPSSLSGKDDDTDCSLSSRIASVHGEVFSGSALEPPPVPPRRVVSEHYTDTEDLVQSAKPKLDRKRSHSASHLPTRRPPPPPPPPPVPPRRRNLPSEHDGVHVQSMLSVKDTLWIGSSCGEILVICVEKTDLTLQNQTNEDKRHAKLKPQMSRARLSLNLKAKQMCNLKSVRMSEDSKATTDLEQKHRSGGVHKLIQARNLVVAVRSISQAEETKDVAEIAVWEACSAERIASIRNYWRSLARPDNS